MACMNPAEDVANLVVRGLYRDSVQLMELMDRLKRMKGVVDAAVVMATDSNREALKKLGLLTQQGLTAGPNDIIVAVKATDAASVLETARELLLKGSSAHRKGPSLDEAINEKVDFASISVPGRYVNEIASRLLERGTNLFIFSDHVPIDVEVSLKTRAREMGVLVMGPEAGTAIIGGIGFGFANSIKKGPVGVVGSAGSGIQELAVLLDWMGIGISHAIGVGGRDLTKQVGGISSIEALKILMDDRDTQVIAVITKQSDEEIVKTVLESVRVTKPIMTAILGSQRKYIGQYPNSPTLHNLAIEICRTASVERFKAHYSLFLEEVVGLKRLVGEGLGHPRGFYSGGTLATETAYIWNWLGLQVYTNMTHSWTKKLAKSSHSEGATVVDFGDEEFTHGRPHPIIDPSLRNARVSAELSLEDVAAVVMDLIIGYGAPDNIVEKTVGEVGWAIRSHAKKLAIHVVGTPSDHQWGQTGLLEGLPIVRAPSNALAAAFAAAHSIGEVDVIERVSNSLILGDLA